MMESVLIANRGEIARRIIRTARRLGIRTIAVYSDPDAGTPFVREADLAVCIGGARPSESYLSTEKVLRAARQAKAAAIHPGYGFLSENPDFAAAVTREGMIWVGAPAAAIRTMGLKDAAKRRMIQAGVAVTPGYLGDRQDSATLEQQAQIIGYPVLIKAVAGGGGRGMRKVTAPGEFHSALASCRRESLAAFGDDRVLIEKCIECPRHIEVQVFADLHGQVIHLFERDCSVQRRHQKIIEEAPAPGMTGDIRESICSAAVQAAHAVQYAGAGTVEFIADASAGLSADRIWFMEMNTRLQVEHAVTEAITGQDLVEWQLRIASGEPLPLRQDQLAIDGWAIEARLYAEDPAREFLPSIGPIRHLRLPTEVRVDSGVEEGGQVSAYYDPMMAKLTAHGGDRETAAAQLANACADIEVWPIKTNAGLLKRCLALPEFLHGEVDTGFVERHAAILLPTAQPSGDVLQGAARALLKDAVVDSGAGPWRTLVGFRMAQPPERRVCVEVAGRSHLVTIDERELQVTTRRIQDERILFADGEAWELGSRHALHRQPDARIDGTITAPIPGSIVALDVKMGGRVNKGQRLLVLEAMKMEHHVVASLDGTVAALPVAKGQQVAAGELLVRIESIKE